MKTAGRPQAISPEAVEQCQAAGMTQAATAQQLGASLSTVQKHWKRAEQHGRPSDTAARVAELAAQGLQTKEIAARLGVDRSTVKRAKQKTTGA